MTAPADRARIVLAMLLVAGAIVLTRLRGGIAPWAWLHSELGERGVPEPVRLLDGSLVRLAAALLAARIALGKGRVADALALRGSLRQGLWVGAVAAMPFVAIAALAARGSAGPDWLAAACAVAVVIVRDVCLLGVLVALPVRFAGWPFWRTAVAAVVLYQALQLPWDGTIAGDDVVAAAVAAALGVSLAWLAHALAWNLWPALVLDAAMTAAWVAFAMGDVG